MNRIKLCFALFLLIAVPATAQVSSEFEGIIKYRHSFRFYSPDFDTSTLIEALGVSSVFYYKEGNYKWVINSPNSEKTEYLDSKTQTAYYLFPGNDTLFRSLWHGYDDSLLVFEEEDNADTVCGLRCKKARMIFFTKSEPTLLTRKVIYYSPDVTVPPGRFASYRTYGTNRVIPLTKCWPIKIEIESRIYPYAFILEAYEIIPRKLTASQVYLPANKPVKQLPLF